MYSDRGWFPCDLCALQVKSIQDAIRDKQKKFLFVGVEISLTPTVGLFITMNPGYAGRTELPENLKALFRLAGYLRNVLLFGAK